MLQSIHFISNLAPGAGHTDGASLPCFGVSGRAICLLQNSSYRRSKKFQTLSLQSTSRKRLTICDATSSNNRRSPHFPRQNNHGYSRGRNRQSEAGDSSEKVEDPDMFSKDGPVLTSSGSSKFQATAAPGPREREIVQLFRKVQAQLRERAEAKEEKKIDETQKISSKPTETVDSLLKLLRKHSVQEGKKTVRSDSNRDFNLDQSVQNGSVHVEKNTNPFRPNSSIKQEKQEVGAPVTTRPRSNFQRRSPVPQVLPEYPHEEPDNADFGRKGNQETLEPELDIDSGVESDFEAPFSDDDDDDDDDDLYTEDDDDDDDDEVISVIHEDDSAYLPPKQTNDIHSNLSEMKLTELRALAKARGLKGYSKLKKHDLVELLTES